MGWLRVAVIFCAWVCVCSLVSQSHMKIANNGYQLLVVAIHDSVPDNPALLEKIKTTFTKASKVLYTATRKRAYFQKLFFLLPSTWSNRPQYKPSSSVKITGADIIFSAPRGTTRSFSHTRAYAGCGQQGIHIQLRTDVLGNSHPLAQSSPEKYIIHEFAKLRYGVFDEYPSPGENEFYFSTTFGRLDPVRCTVGLRGIIRGPSGYCLFSSIDPETGEFPAGCKYVPYPYRANGTASMMDHQYVREIKDFCDDDHTPGHFSHNVEPPNRHNRLCSHRSTWDVISNTADFHNNANPPTTLSDQQLTPQFIIFRAPSRRRRRLAVVLDPPQEVDRRLRLHQAVDHFLREGFDADTKVAIIHNGADRKISGRMRSRRSTVIKAILDNVDQNYASFSTIQSQIQSGVQILKKSNSTKAGLELHLVVFNCANQSSIKAEDLQHLSDFDITPHIIHCGGDGTTHVEEIVRQQGGLAESRDHRSIFSGVQRLSDKLHDEKEQKIQILNENLEIGGTTYKRDFTLDETLYGEMVMRIHYNSSPPTVRVFAPNESEYDLHAIDTKLKYIRFTIPISDKEHGKWSLAISNNSPQNEAVHIMVTIRPRVREDEAAVRTQAWVKMFDEYFPPRVGLYAEVVYGEHPVVNAHVTAHVYQNNRNVATIVLRDTGGGLDMMKEDGIYSNSFTEIESHGYHYVEITIEDVYNKTEIHKTHEIQIPPERGIFPDDPDILHAPRLKHHTEKIKLIHGLKRSTSTGHFEIDHRWDLKPENDHYPPARIIDLHVSNVSRKNRTVFLTWTATGENLDTGRANSYEIRYHTNGTALLLTPRDAWLVTKENVVRGNLDRPKEAGQIENVAIQFPSNMKWAAIMLRSLDKHNHAGEFSNMVTTFFEL